MANEIALTAAQVQPLFPAFAEIYSFIATVAITQGAAVYADTSGGVSLADANDSGAEQFRGIALEAGAVGQAISVLKKGHCAGFTVSGMAYDAPAYLSDTVGRLSTAVGTMTVNCGRVVGLTDGPNLTKVLYVDANWNRIWA